MSTPLLGLMPGWQEWIVIGVVALLIFGPRRLPEIADAFGRSITRFKKAMRDAETEVKRGITEGGEATGKEGGDTAKKDDDEA